MTLYIGGATAPATCTDQADGRGLRLHVRAESERLEIAVTPSPSVTNIGRYHVYVSGRGPLFAFAETLDENPRVPTGRLTPGDASNPDVYEWSGFPDPITGVARASSKTLTLYEPVNWDD